MALLLEEDFNAGWRSTSKWFTSRRSYTQDIDGFVRFRFMKDNPYGGSILNKVPISRNKVYLHYHLRLYDWVSNIHETPGMKLPGLAGLYSSSGYGGRKPTLNQPGFSARLFTRGTRIGVYLYHLDQADRNFGDLLYATKPGLPLDTDRGSHNLRLSKDFHCIDLEVKMNRPSSLNGRVRMWVDGELVIDKRGLRFRHDHSVKVKDVWLNFWRHARPFTLEADIDHLRVTTRRIKTCDL